MLRQRLWRYCQGRSRLGWKFRKSACPELNAKCASVFLCVKRKCVQNTNFSTCFGGPVLAHSSYTYWKIGRKLVSLKWKQIQNLNLVSNVNQADERRLCNASFYQTDIGESLRSRGLITSEPRGTHLRLTRRIANVPPHPVHS